MTTIYEQDRLNDKETQGFRVYTRYFNFEISNPKSGATGEEGGFVDAMKAQDYVDFDPTAGTLDKNRDKARGYIRWVNLCLSLSKFGVFFQEVNELTGATALDTPTKIKFTMGYENANEEALYIKDGEQEYKGAQEVFKYLAGWALSHNYKSFADVWNPELDSQGKNPSGGPIGFQNEFLSCTKLFDTLDDAMAAVTIEEIDFPDGDITISDGSNTIGKN